MNKLAILGAGGHGKVIADLAQLNGWRQIDFYDDAWPEKKDNRHWLVVGDALRLRTALKHYQGLMIAIGDNRIRAQKLKLFLDLDAPLVTLIHPAAQVSRYVSFGPGCVVMAGACVNADTRVGAGAIVNTGCSIDHDCLLGTCVHVSPGARIAGGVRIGDESWIGLGACVNQQLTIGAGVMVGAGAVVVKDLPDGVTAVGVPARY